MEELGCGRATRFDDMKVYYRLLFTDADFRYYPFPYQAILMGQHNISVSGGTLTNWKNKLFEKGLIVKDTTDYRYFLCKAGKKPQEISREEFSTIWQACFKHTKNGTEQPEAIKNMSNEHGGIPNKICGFYESALERERIDKLRSLLDV
ncbi:MAG: hypothetical protein HFF09_07755 [Oscillospiraceae bacterium]|nr:hypothetical protein [Oscillospiraceae bacterium]